MSVIATASTVATRNGTRDYCAEFKACYAACGQAQAQIDNLTSGIRATRAHMIRIAYVVRRDCPQYVSSRSETGLNVTHFGADFIPPYAASGAEKSGDAIRREAGRYLNGMLAAIAAGLEAELSDLDAVPSAALIEAANTAWDEAKGKQKKYRDDNKDDNKGESGGGSQSTTDEPGSGSPETQLKEKEAVSGDTLVAALDAAAAMVAELRGKGMDLTPEQAAKVRGIASFLSVFAA